MAQSLTGIRVNGTDVADVLSASGGGDHVVLGGYGNDTLSGGSGDDIFIGGQDNDTYRINRGDGSDVIFNYDPNGEGSAARHAGFDQIRFGTNISPDDIAVSRVGSDLFLTDTVTGQRTAVHGHFHVRGAELGRVVFADGTVWYAWKILQMASLDWGPVYGPENIVGTVADDTLNGGYGNDTLWGGKGNDTLKDDAFDSTMYGGAGDDLLVAGTSDDLMVGGPGDDTYDLGYFAGHNVIDNDEGDGPDAGAGFDRVEISGQFTPDDILVLRRGDDAFLVRADEERERGLTIKNQFGDPSLGVDQVVFDDGTIWRPSDLLALSRMDTGRNDEIVGTAQGEQLEGGGGDDQLHGFAGDDTLLGGTGEDTLRGGEGIDHLDGGTGADVLDGGAGHDSYHFARGSGQDTITAQTREAAGDDFDQILMGAGITPDDLVVTGGTLGDLVLSIKGTQDRLFVGGYFNEDSAKIGRVVFEDGTIWYPWKLEQRLQQTSEYDDTIYGSEEADVIDALAGDDLIEGGAGDDLLIGGAGDDVIVGRDGNDTMIGGADNDSLYGAAGSDTYFFEGNYGRDSVVDGQPVEDGVPVSFNQIRFGDGIDPADVELRRDGYSLILDTGGNEVSVDLHYYSFFEGNFEIGRVVFADGTIWYPWKIEQLINADRVIRGGSLDDTLTGRDGDDTLNGAGGNDSLAGGKGSDTYQFDLGFGQDTVNDNGSSIYAHYTDVIEFGEGITLEDIAVTRVIDTLRLSHVNGIDEVIVENHGPYTIEEIHFSNGTVWQTSQFDVLPILGTDGDDEIFGAGEDDRIIAGAGNDNLYGDRGADWLMPGAGDNYVYGGPGTDMISFSDLGAAVKIDMRTHSGSATSDLGYTTFNFVENATGTRFVDDIAGNELANKLRGLAGNDRLEGGGGDDVLEGGRGFDRAIYSGDFAEYAITTEGSIATVTHLNGGADGTDVLHDMEQLVFEDQTFLL